MTNVVAYSFEGAGLRMCSSGPASTSVLSLAFPSIERQRVKDAFRRWEWYGDFVAVEVPATGVAGWSGSAVPLSPDVQVRMYFGPWDNNPTTSGDIADAHGSPGYNNVGSGLGEIYHGIIQCDSADWSVLSPTQAFYVYLHEMGHGIAGVGPHNNSDTNAIMCSSVNIYTGGGYPIVSEQAACAAMHGVPQTWSTKLGSGALIGDVWSLYKGLQGVQPDAAGLAYWNKTIKNGSQSRTSLASALGLNSGADYSFVANLYAGALGRSGSAAEINWWISQIPSLGRLGVCNAIALSSEAITYRQSALAGGCWLS